MASIKERNPGQDSNGHQRIPGDEFKPAQHGEMDTTSVWHQPDGRDHAVDQAPVWHENGGDQK